jgi:hypothetical protein
VSHTFSPGPEGHHRDRPDDLHGPAVLAGTPRYELLAALTFHENVLTNARHGIGQPVSSGRLRAAALDALAVGRALGESATRWEWCTQIEALEHGAPLHEVASSCGVTPEEVVVGLRARVDGQHEHGLMPWATAGELLSLVERAAAMYAREHADGGRVWSASGPA